MTFNQAYQEFFDNAFHNSMKPHISDEAKALAMAALAEKIERDNPKPLTFHELMNMKEEPVWLYDYGVYHWALVSGCMDYTSLGEEKKSGKLVNFIYETDDSYPMDSFPLDDMGELWVAYKYKPKEV